MSGKFDSKAHLAKLQEISERLDRHEIDQNQMREEINKLLGENTFFNRLKEHLIGSVNGKISSKMKERLQNLNNYFRFRAQLENRIIFETDWSNFFDLCDWTNEPLEDLKSLSTSDLITYNIIVIQALEGYIDANRELEAKTQKLHEIYLLVQSELETRIPDYPKRDGKVIDGFNDYLATRDERLQKQKQLDNARILGNICIYCGSTDVHSKGSEWICRTCGKRFCKHKA